MLIMLITLQEIIDYVNSHNEPYPKVGPTIRAIDDRWVREDIEIAFGYLLMWLLLARIQWEGTDPRIMPVGKRGEILRAVITNSPDLASILVADDKGIAFLPHISPAAQKVIEDFVRQNYHFRPIP